MEDKFVRHVRALLATGSSGRSVRAQLFLNGGFFLSERGYSEFKEHMPELRWFQTQRDGLGNESLMYTFLRIVKLVTLAGTAGSPVLRMGTAAVRYCGWIWVLQGTVGTAGTARGKSGS